MAKILTPKKGTLLISQPLIGDGFFEQSVIVLTNHGNFGTMGFSLNKKSSLFIRDVFEDFPVQTPLYFGGPVEPDSLFFLHLFEGLPNSKEVAPGLFMGGSFEGLKERLSHQHWDTNHPSVKLFLGYSGWSVGQLAEEIADKTWIVESIRENQELLTMNDKGWRDQMKNLGGTYSLWANAPEDPVLN
jgi:putative transcriptional regulator